MNFHFCFAIKQAAALLWFGFGLVSVAFGQAGQAGFDATGAGAYSFSGKVFHPLGGFADIRASALQSDQKLLLTGACGTGAICVARLLENGGLDTSFVGPPGNPLGWSSLGGGFGSLANAVTVDATGQILVGGMCGGSTACIARLNSDGSIDSSWLGDFAGTQNGFATYPNLGQGEAMVLLPLSDGKVLLAGSCKAGGSAFLFCIARLNADGSLDATFGGLAQGGGGGWAATGIGFGTQNRLLSAARQTDGSIVMVGLCQTSVAGIRFCLARYSASGSLDTSFGGAASGRFLLNILATNSSNSFNEQARTVLIQSDGKLLVLGLCAESANREFCGVRLMSDGTVDTTFTGPFGISAGKFRLAITQPAIDTLEGAVLQPDGRLLLVGTCDLVTGARICAARLLANGKLDTSFAGTNLVLNGPNAEAYVDGRLTLAPSLASFASGGAHIQSDGKILIVGRCVVQLGQQPQACAVRLRGRQGSSDLDLDNATSATGDGLKFFQLLRDPALREERLFDVDGDGVIDETDALVFARALAGFTENRVIDGISFSQNALRTDWTSIRTYLVNVRGVVLP